MEFVEFARKYDRFSISFEVGGITENRVGETKGITYGAVQDIITISDKLSEIWFYGKDMTLIYWDEPDEKYVSAGFEIRMKKADIVIYGMLTKD